MMGKCSRCKSAFATRPRSRPRRVLAQLPSPPQTRITITQAAKVVTNPTLAIDLREAAKRLRETAIVGRKRETPDTGHVRRL